jgi:hypothetical protein
LKKHLHFCIECRKDLTNLDFLPSQLCFTLYVLFVLLYIHS